MSNVIVGGAPISADAALQKGRHRPTILLGQLDRNQGGATFTGRMTLEEFADRTVVHNKRWAEDAGESLNQVTQRDIIEAHAIGLALFIVQGLVDATIKRSSGDPEVAPHVDTLNRILDCIGRSMHYALPPVTLVIERQPEIVPLTDSTTGQGVGARMIVPSGVFFYVADGQHRREAAKRVRTFLNELLQNRRAPKGSKLYHPSAEPISVEEVEAWGAVEQTFRAWSYVAYEAHIGLTVDQARQMFTNYNCHVKPVKAELNLEFDQSNPINKFGKNLIQVELAQASSGASPLDARQVASINGFLFLGKSTIVSAPFNITSWEACAREFWTCVLQSDEWRRTGTLLREVPILKGLAKSWFHVFIAKRHMKRAHAPDLRSYIRTTKFDAAWARSVVGLMDHTVKSENDVGFRFSPAHNDIVARIVAHALPEKQTATASE